MSRGVFFDEDVARAVTRRLLDGGFAASCQRERFAGEDDDEDHPWAVSTDAPAVILELLVEEYDGWLELESPSQPAMPVVLPTGPRRMKQEPSAPDPRIDP